MPGLTPAVANLVPIPMVRGLSAKGGLFMVPDATVPKDKAGMYPFVNALSTVDGEPFTATIVTMVVKMGTPAAPVVLVGAVITTAGGWVGTVGPEHCAGTGFSFS